MHTSNNAFMELLPIFLSATVRGSRWQSCRVTCHCGNESVVAVINKGSTKDLSLVHLLTCISFYATYYHFTLQAQHVPGTHNQIADALSRNNMLPFSFLHPQTVPVPEPIPQEAIQIAMMTNTDWTRQTWRALFKATLPKDSLNSLFESTPHHRTEPISAPTPLRTHAL